MSIAVGSVHVDVLPSTRDFVKKMKADILAGADTVGRELGEEIGRAAAEAAGAEIADGVENGIDDADVEGSSTKKGKRGGDAFGRAMRAEIEKALSNLPDIELNGDAEGVLADIALVREELQELRDKNIGVDISGSDALAEIASIKAVLESIRDESIDVDINFDTDQAAAALGQLERKIANDAGGAFDRTLRQGLQNAIKDLPTIDVDVDTDAAIARLQAIREELVVFSDMANIDLNIDADTAIADVQRISAELRAIVDDETIDLKIRFDAAQALAGLGSITAATDKLKGDVEELDREMGAFARNTRIQLEAALRNLPDIEVNADTSRARAELQDIRENIAALKDLEIGVDLNDTEAIAGVDRLIAQLQFLANFAPEVDVRVNSAKAIDDLLAFRATVANATEDVEVDVEVNTAAAEAEIGAFARTVRAQLAAAMSDLPDIQIDADTSPARAALQEIRTEVAALTDLEIGVDIDESDAVAGIARLMAELEVLSRTAPEVEVRFNSIKLLADLAKLKATLSTVAEPIEVPVDVRNPGEFTSKVKALLASVQATLPELVVDADTGPAEREVVALRGLLEGLHANIGVDIDAGTALTQLAAIEAALKAIDLETVTVEVKADIGSALAQIAAFEAAVVSAGDAGGASISRMRLIIAAVIALFPLAAGAVLGLTAALSLVVTPVAAIAAGIGGIKTAVQPLIDDLERLKTAVSQAFEAGLEPAVRNAAELFPALTEGLIGTAGALSTVAENVSEVVTSAANIHTISDSFDKLNIIVESLSPAIETFTQNLISLTNTGAAGLAAFGTQLNQVATDFGVMIERITATGTAEAAIQALFQVLSSIIGLIGPLTELGSVLLASFGPALSVALDGLGAILTVIATALDGLGSAFGVLSGPIQAFVAIAITLRITMLALSATFPSLAAASGVMATAWTGLQLAGLSLATTFTAVRTAISLTSFSSLAVPIAVAATAFRGLAVAIRGVLTALISNPIGLIIVGIVTAMSLLGQANSDAAAAETEHKQAVQELASALRDSGGAISSSVLAMTNQKLEAANLGDAFKELGLNQTTVALATANGGKAFDDLRAKLTGLAAETVNHTTLVTASEAAQQKQAEAAQSVLDVIGPLRDDFISAADANKALAAALLITGTSLAGGLANATALEGAITTLGNASSTTSDKVKALTDALNALDGGTVTAEAAAKTLNDAIRDLGPAFEEAQKSGKKIVDVSGALDTTTEAGSKLFDATVKIRDGMIGAATTAFDAAGGLNNVAGAGAAAAEKVQSARDAFVKAAEAAGLNATQAQLLADHYGLIPGLVTTLLKAEGLPQVNQELLQLSSLITNQIPGTKEITVKALSADALATLDALHVQVEQLPDGQFKVTIDDQTEPAIQAALGFIAKQKGVMPVDGDTTALQNAVAIEIAALEARKAKLPVTATMERQEIDDQISNLQSTPVPIPVTSNTTGVQPPVDAAKSAITSAPPAQVGVDANTTAVQPAAQAAAAQVATITALINIDVGSKAGIETWIANLQRTIATPINMSVGVYDNATVVIQRIMAAAVAPAQFTITAVDANATAMIEIIRANAQGGAQFTITGVDSGVQGLIDGLRGSAQQGAQMPIVITDNATATINAIRSNAQTISVMPIDANPAGATGKLQALVASVTGTTAVMKIDSTVDLATGKLTAMVATVTGTTAIMKIDADTALADAKLRDLVARINGSQGTVTINANTGPFDAAMAQVLKPRSVSVTVNEVPGTQVGPNALGGFWANGVKAFASGGFNNGMAKAMSAATARIVPPNTFRVIGDRARGDEAFIPINNSPRSQSLLGITAARMGFALTPVAKMAAGGLLDPAAIALLQKRQKLIGQTTSAFGALGAAGPAGAVLGALGGSNNTKTLEGKFDQMIAAVKEADNGPRQITVEDKSGNPVETARATQLALRLARH